jgi:MoaA/NifB/PqqE/SkfB family radical SAM enzyme
MTPITTARSLDELHAALHEARILGPDPRFMHLEMDITSRCNIRCVMCYHSFDEFSHSKAVLFPVEAFERLAATLLPRAHTLTLSLGSEPTTSPHFVPILRSAATYGVPNLTFFTNGTLLHDATIAAIIESNVTEICISIDGATAATYEAIRRDAHFDQVIGNIRRLVAARTARGRPEPRLRFDVVMMKRNVHELPALVELASSLGIDAINFFHMVVYEGLHTEGQSLRRHQDLSDLWLGRAVARAAELGLRIAAHPRRFEDERQSAAPAASPYADSPYCMYPFFHVSMNSGGHVLACPFSHGEAPFGTIGPETTFEAIWLGSKFSELRRRILESDPPDMCRRCSYLASRYPNVEALFAPRPSNRPAPETRA